MVSIPFQQDLKVSVPEDTQQKYTLSISPTGDIQLVEGKEKLVEQLIHAVVNDEALSQDLINNKGITSRILNTLFTVILRNFRQNQVNDTNRSDPNFSGFVIYRKASGSNDKFRRVSSEPIVWRYTNTELENGVSYDYAITKIYRNTFESGFLEKFTTLASGFSNNQHVIIGKEVVLIPGDKQITFYVDYNRKFKGTELMDKLLSINAYQNPNEPREFTVEVKIQDLNGNPVSIATQRISASSGQVI